MKAKRLLNDKDQRPTQNEVLIYMNAQGFVHKVRVRVRVRVVALYIQIKPFIVSKSSVV